MISIITPVRAKDATGVQWLHEAIYSVYQQDYTDWEMVIVDDHSDADLRALKYQWRNVRWVSASGQGVSMARNQAAAEAHGSLLLPLDADDKLAPSALEKFATAWQQRGDAGIIYSDVVMFGQDYSRVYLAAEYNFTTLLKATFMTVGCLHRKSDWERAGGWRVDLSTGLEDWEYWIKLGEMGVCGKRIAEPLYWYRRHPTGRLAWLKANKDLWSKAYQTMRSVHGESYAGRYPMGCCGGGRAAAPKAPAMQPARVAAQQAIAQAQGSGLVPMVYVGSRAGGFSVVSGVSRTRYDVPGQGQVVVLARTTIQGVKPEDVAWFRSVGGGRDFRLLEVPAAAPPIAAAAIPPADPESEAWTPATMESVPLPEAPEEKSERKPRRSKSG